MRNDIKQFIRTIQDDYERLSLCVTPQSFTEFMAVFSEHVMENPLTSLYANEFIREKSETSAIDKYCIKSFRMIERFHILYDMREYMEIKTELEQNDDSNSARREFESDSQFMRYLLCDDIYHSKMAYEAIKLLMLPFATKTLEDIKHFFSKKSD